MVPERNRSPERVTLAYGESGLALTVDPRHGELTLIEPRYQPGLGEDAARAALRRALEAPIAAPPLRELARRARRIGIVFSDLTRPTPNHLLVPAVLELLDGVPEERVLLFDALGTHRENTRAELAAMLGAEITGRYRIVQNNAFDPAAQRSVGRGRRGHEVRLDRELLDCDLRVLTGFIEPHLFAGFSGGGKAILPGMAGLETILHNHDAEMIGHPAATWCIADGNPIFEEIREVTCGLGGCFLLNVALDRERRIAGIFAGALREAHAVGCAFVRELCVVPVASPFDVIVTSNGGYPADLNLYQSVKGMSAAARALREGGTIILAAECRDGIPEHGRYRELLREAASPAALLERIRTPGFLCQDQWEAQIQAQVQLRGQVLLRSDRLTPAQIEEALLTPCARIEDAIAELAASATGPLRIGVMPLGPQAIPELPPSGYRRRAPVVD
jgi:nickel-dependent lactate racemase